MTQSAITLSEHTIHNPAEPRHFMRVKPIARRVRVLRDGVVLAETEKAMRLQEVGQDVYDPAIYIPRADLFAKFAASEKSTHCPLKGDAGYLSLSDENGATVEPDIAWHYDDPFGFAAEITGHVSFYTDKVTIEEAPL